MYKSVSNTRCMNTVLFTTDRKTDMWAQFTVKYAK